MSREELDLEVTSMEGVNGWRPEGINCLAESFRVSAGELVDDTGTVLGNMGTVSFKLPGGDIVNMWINPDGARRMHTALAEIIHWFDEHPHVKD